jgi:hypothetical protein
MANLLVVGGMADFIAARIIEAREISLEAGQEKYRAYFVNTTRYVSFQSAVNAILIQNNCEDCIVTV